MPRMEEYVDDMVLVGLVGMLTPIVEVVGESVGIWWSSRGCVYDIGGRSMVSSSNSRLGVVYNNNNKLVELVVMVVGMVRRGGRIKR